MWVGLGSDPKIRTTGAGKRVVDLWMALDRGLRDSDDKENTTAWLSGTMFDNDDQNSKFVFGQIDAGNMKKGSQLAITGSLKMDAYTNKDSVKVERAGVMISSVTYVGGGEKKGGDDAGTKPESGSSAGNVIEQF